MGSTKTCVRVSAWFGTRIPASGSGLVISQQDRDLGEHQQMLGQSLRLMRARRHRLQDQDRARAVRWTLQFRRAFQSREFFKVRTTFVPAFVRAASHAIATS
jgi:hypothetical protein